MATLLYRLGRFSFRRPFLVIGVWLLLLVGILGGGTALGGKTQESFAIPGTESQEALDRLSAVFPQVAGASAQAVVAAPAGSAVTDAPATAAIAEMVTAITAIDGVDSVVGPFDQYAGTAVSDDGSLARIQVQFDGSSEGVTPATLDALTETRRIGEDAGLQVEFGGQVFQDNTFGITVTEVFGVIFAGVVLFVTFGSLLAAGMPLLSALIGVGIVVGGITTISAFTSVSSTAPLLALMIGLAVGIDYSLFILSRHRNQLALGADPEESAATAVGTAGGAVVFAGVTVIIALLGLLVVGIPFLSVMGVGAAFAVLIAIFVATTLLPAILGLTKGRLTPRPGSRAYRRALASAHSHGEGAEASSGTRERPTFGLRWVSLVMKAPVVAVVGVVLILGALAIPALSLDLNLPDNGSEPEESTQRKAYDLVSEGFGPGYNGPLIVAIDITQTTDVLGDLESIGDELRSLDDVAEVSQGAPDAGLDTAIIQVTPESAPDATATKDLVQAIRDRADAIEDEYGTPISVTGATAVGIDISNRLTTALVPFGVIVVGLSVVLLMMVFRSVLVPIKAALGFLLSVVASFGVVVMIFQWGYLADLLNVENPGPILSFMPILLMAVLFGLAMDYEVFLVSGMREEFVRTRDARRSVRAGFGGAARVVTAAALIMFFVFFAFVPEGAGAIKTIAFGLAVGVAFDAFLVRMTLVPAVMALLGRSAWWLPRWLDRLLPDFDIEGERLREHLDAGRWAAGQQGDAVSTEALLVGDDPDAAPLDLRAAPGSLVLVAGSDDDRRRLLLALVGAVPPRSGRAQVLGHPLPSGAAAVSRLVAVADLRQADASSPDGSVRELLEERLRLTRPWYRAAGVRRDAERLLALLREHGHPDAAGRLPASALPPLDRALTLALVAISEQTPVVLLDAGDLADPGAFLAAVDRLAPSPTTLLVGLGPDAGRIADRVAGGTPSGRPVVRVALPGGARRDSSSEAAAVARTASRPAEAARGLLAAPKGDHA